MSNKSMTLEEFNKLTRAEKAVYIAQDVLAQLAAKKYIADHVYLTFTEQSWSDIDLNEELQDVIKDKQCHVCAIGGILASVVSIRDQFKAALYRTADHFHEVVSAYLTDAFSERQLSLMECAFEGRIILGYRNYTLEDEDFKRAFEMNRLFYDRRGTMERKEYNEASDKLLQAIMLNIIENKGEFIP